MGIVSGHAIKFWTRQKTHSDAVPPAFVHHALQTQIMALLQHSDPFERPPACLQRLSNGIDPVDVIHRATSLPSGKADVREPASKLGLIGPRSEVSLWYFQLALDILLMLARSMKCPCPPSSWTMSSLPATNSPSC